MKVYVVMVDDVHTDPEPEVFTTADAAINYARATAQEMSRRPEDYEEEQVDGWLFHATYSCEGDDVWVVEKDLHVPEMWPDGTASGEQR